MGKNKFGSQELVAIYKNFFKIMEKKENEKHQRSSKNGKSAA